MKSIQMIAAVAAFCITCHAAETADTVIITDPTKIVDSTTYDLGDRLLTVQELTKDALPMPTPPTPRVTVQPTSTPRRINGTQTRGFINVGAHVYKRTNQPTRSLIHYQISGQAESITFWSSADWSLIAGIGNLTGADGKIWHLMCVPSVYDLDRKTPRQQNQVPVIPEMPAGATTYQVVTGSPTAEQMAPIALYHAYYDAHLQELKATQQARITEQQRLAAEAKAKPPEDIVVQYRVLEPAEIITPQIPSTPSE